MKLSRLWKGVLFVCLAVLLVACQEGEGAADSKGTQAASDDATSIEGNVVIDGSGTVYPLMAKIAEEYMLQEQETVSVEVSRAGTSAGFKKFLVENGTDFNNASRQIKTEEMNKAEELGMDVKEIKVALDGLTFVINKENDWAKEMTADELKQVFLAESNVTKWSDINSDWPDETIHTYGPNENHGTYEFFYENILEEQDLIEDVNLQQEYSTLVNLIADDKNGIAFFGFGYYVNNQDKLQAVEVDFGQGAIEPSLETIAEDGDYADFTRPVFTYLNENMAKEKPQVLDFTLYALKNINEYAGETGFAPIPEEEVKQNMEYVESLK